jgi:DNA adenine methylase
MSRATPYIKWVGGKTQLLPQLLDLFPKKIGTYIEPFIGGGSVYYAVAAERRFEHAIINDWNTELVTTYRMVRDVPDQLMALLRSIEEEYVTSPEEIYYAWRAKDPKELSPVETATRFIFLNKAGFNGLYRVNQKGGFNSPWGKRLKVNTFDYENIRACSVALGGTLEGTVTIRQGDFADAVTEAKSGDCVYFDPPYVPLTPTASFTSYTSGGFGLKDQQRLAVLFKELAGKGVKVVLSNSDTPVVRDLYAGCTILSVMMRRAINSDGEKRGAVGEVLVVGGTE